MWLGRRAEAARFDGPGHSGRWPALLCLVVIPALLHLPIWRYSLATPFALVDDYGNWFFTLVDDYGNRHYLRALDSFAEFQTWLVAIFDLPDGRYRPFWDLSNVVAWALYGDNPWAHHLSRWFFHIATAILFCAAFLRFHDIRSPLPALRAGALAHGVRLVPPATFLYVLLFTPNLPAARLAPQEVHTVFFLSFCTLAAALTLAPSGAPTSKARRGAYILLLFGVLGLASCKETNVAIVLWIWLAYHAYGVLARTVTNPWRWHAAGAPLLLVLLFTVYHIQRAHSDIGLGYGRHSPDIVANANTILSGVSHWQTSCVIAVGLAILLTVLVLATGSRAARAIKTRTVDNELLFILFLAGQIATAFVTLCLIWHVTLRYWHVLLPPLAVLLGFASKYLLAAAARSEWLLRAAVIGLSLLLVFFVACNYYNFAFQTIVQHSYRHAERRLIEAIDRLSAAGEWIAIDHIDTEPGNKLLRDVPAFYRIYRSHDINVRAQRPADGRPFHMVTLTPPLERHADVTIIASQRNYSVANGARRLAAFLQGGPPFRRADGGVHYGNTDGLQLQWHIVHQAGSSNQQQPSNQLKPAPRSISKNIDAGQSVSVPAPMTGTGRYPIKGPSKGESAHWNPIGCRHRRLWNDFGALSNATVTG